MTELIEDPGVGGRGTVLFVEDDLVLAEIMTAKLQELGYAVRGVPSAEEALESLRSGAVVDVVFSDVVLAGEMSGFQLARTIGTEFPTLPILLATGFSSALDVAQIRGFETVPKPYDVALVARRLGAMIVKKRSGGTKT